MLIIPAIDLRGGRCVRLMQGRKQHETTYSTDPVAVALRWQQEGASRLHLVDLDGAFDGSPQNKAVIAAIAGSLQIPIQLGGGLRTFDAVKEAFQLGIDKVILGTVAVEKPLLLERLSASFGPRLMVGIDAKKGAVAIKGWEKETDLGAVELARRVYSRGVPEIIYTDIARDGMLAGPNLEALEEMTSVRGLKIIASGGISSLEDLKNIQRLEKKGVSGAIIGKALYDRRFSLKEALAVTGGKG